MVLDRRLLTLGFAALAASPALAQTSSSAYAFTFDGLHGEPVRLADFAGRVLLVVNTASTCGFTPQFADLQTVWERYRERGLTVVGVPSDDFNQEHGTAAEIAAVCQGQYGVAFPMAGKQTVRGPKAHPFYRWVASQRPADVPTWNFHKFVIGRSGAIVGAFPARVRPVDPRIVALIETQLGGA
jgi:glutathione peroxidase